MTEIWKDVVGYEGLYEVSNLGKVRSKDRVTIQNNNGTCVSAKYKGKMLKGRTDPRGYTRVHISKNGKPEAVSVHRIVAMAFCDKPEGCDIVNHLDNDPSNNSANNLEWTTYKGNMQWAAIQGRMKPNYENLKKAQESHKKAVIAIDSDGNESFYESMREASEALNIKGSHIGDACRKEYGYKTVGGYEWEYFDSELQKKALPKKTKMSPDEYKDYMRKRMLGNKYMLGRHLSEGTKRKLATALGKKVIQYTLEGEKIAEFPSAIEARRITGISHIDDVANEKRKSAGGYIWKWSE